jgi:hypothetical protein
MHTSVFSLFLALHPRMLHGGSSCRRTQEMSMESAKRRCSGEWWVRRSKECRWSQPLATAYTCRNFVFKIDSYLTRVCTILCFTLGFLVRVMLHEPGAVIFYVLILLPAFLAHDRASSFLREGKARSPWFVRRGHTHTQRRRLIISLERFGF